jgi:hypothetical protein
MDIPFLIRSGIFLTAGLIVLIFPKQVFRWSSGMMAHLAKLFHIKYTEDKRGIKTMKVFGILFLITAVILLLIAMNR